MSGIKMLKFISLFALLLCSSCSMGQTSFFNGGCPLVPYTEPLEVSTASCRDAKIPEEIIMGGISVDYIFGPYVLLGYSKGEYCNCILNLETGEATKIIHRGNGANEANGTSFTGIRIDGYGDAIVGLYDINKADYMEISIQETLRNGKAEFSNSRKISKNTMFAKNVEDDLLCQILWDNDVNSIKRINPEGKVANTWYYSNDKEMNSDYIHLFASPAINPEGTMAALAMSAQPRINVIDLKTGNTFSIATEKISDRKLKNKIKSLGDNYAKEKCCEKAVASGDFLFVLYNEPFEKGADLQKQTLRVYDWEGRFLKKIKIDCPEKIYTWDFITANKIIAHTAERILYIDI